MLEKDTSLLYFFSYALLVRNKRALLSAPMFAKEALLEVTDIAETKDLEALCQQAKHILQSTPAPLLRAILDDSELPSSQGAGVLQVRRLDPVGMQFFVVVFFDELSVPMLSADLSLLVYLPKQLGLDRVWLILSMLQNYLHENSLFDPVFACTGRPSERNLVDNLALDLARKGLTHVVTLELEDSRFFGGLSPAHEQVRYLVLGKGSPIPADLSEKLFSLYALEWVANTLQIQKSEQSAPENNLLKALDEAHKE